MVMSMSVCQFLSVCLCVCLSVCVSVCVSVCLSVCLQAYLWNYTFSLHHFSVHITYGGGLVLWWRCDMLCISSYMEVVMIADNGQQ